MIRRALVLSGGGAKGVFEAGVIHAIAEADLPIHILTGSSIGAINSAFFAEYLYHKNAPDPADREDESQLLARLHAFLDLWEFLAAEKFVDLDAPHFFAIARSLTRLKISFADLTRAFWLITTPDPPPPRLPDSLLTPFQTFLSELATLRIAVGLTFQLGGNLGEGLSLLWTVIGAAWRCRAAFLAKRGSEERVTAARQLRQSAGATYDRALRARLKALDIERAVFQGGALRDVFTRPRLKDTPAPALIPAARRLSAYHGAGIDLRFTRTNLRSGRLEYSAFFTPERALFNRGDDGNFKLKEQGDLRVFGDPRVVDAAIASGAFPFAFPPRRFEELYPAPEPGEAAAYQELLADFVNYLARRDAGGVGDLVAPPACRWTEHDDATGEARTYQAALTEADWRQIASVFPRPGDLYVDGGAIDNTPLASAISATRDAGAGELQAIVVMLDPAPEYRAIARSEMESLTPLGIGLRALQLQANARLERDAEHAEALTRRWANLMQAASEAGARDAVEGGAGQSGLMPVSVVRIWPGPPPERPLPPLLAFDERLGYNREDSRAALTQGCAAMLWALWEQAEKIEAGDAVRRRVESFVQPDSVSGARSPQTWHCANRDCRYYQEQNPALRCRRAE